MERLTYKQAYDKSIEAYFKNEIEPFDPEFCFCGTLCGNSMDWYKLGNSKSPIGSHYDYSGYTGIELKRMEAALLMKVAEITETDYCDAGASSHPKYEEAIFEGMCAALETLKQIHIARGENVDDLPVLKKRILQIAQ